MAKVIYIDTETTGFDPKKHGLTEVGAIVVENYIEVDHINLYINATTYSVEKEITKEAIDLCGKNLCDLVSYPHQSTSFGSFMAWCREHSKNEKIQLVGYNIDFDIKFIKAWFKENDEDFYNIFSHRTLDVLDLVRHLHHACVLRTKDGKLATLCEHFDIPIEAHTAKGDARATMLLHRELLRRHIRTHEEDKNEL